MSTDPNILETLAALGLTLTLDFITPEDEQALLPMLRVSAAEPQRTASLSKGRSAVQRYGDASAYNNYIVSATIPERFAVLGRRLFEQGLVAHLPDSITVNEYHPGDTIPAHIDALKAGRVITVLSLGSPATMVFALKGTNTRHSVLLPPRSLAQMRDDIRYQWTHEILPVPAQRYSIVFRCSHDV